jgi:hypothetical protein
MKTVPPWGRYFGCPVTEEMYFLELFVRDMLQSVGLVPSVREDVKRNLATNREGKPVVRKFILQDFDESSSEAVFLRMDQM